MMLKRVFSLIVAFSAISMIVFLIKLNFKEDITAGSISLPSLKPFIYLTETEQCLPPNLATSSQIGDPETCNCDVIVLSYRAKCQEDNRSHVSYLFDPNTHFASGRNVLFFAAMDRRPGYRYYIFLDDDAVINHNKETPNEMLKLSPFRLVEKWLLDYEPAVGVLDYVVHHGANFVRRTRKDLCGINETSLVIPTAFYDAMFNAFHYKAIEHILPYPTQYEKINIYSCNRHTMLVVEVKFSGQALLFAAVTARNSKHRGHTTPKTNYTEISREFVTKIKQEAPPKIRNHELFDKLYNSPKPYLTHQSRSYCANVTRNQPIIPYRHLLADV
ncbi:hypothetical protein ACROYT_G028870 [Oculina patagonica]